MFLLLRNKQGLPVFSLQCSPSANIPQCSDEHGRMGGVSGLRLFSGFCFSWSYSISTRFWRIWVSPSLSSTLLLSYIIYGCSPSLPLLTIARVQVIFSCLPHACTDKLTSPAHLHGEGRREVHREVWHDYPRLFNEWVAELGLELCSPHWWLCALPTKLRCCRCFFPTCFVLK